MRFFCLPFTSCSCISCRHPPPAPHDAYLAHASLSLSPISSFISPPHAGTWSNGEPNVLTRPCFFLLPVASEARTGGWRLAPGTCKHPQGPEYLGLHPHGRATGARGQLAESGRGRAEKRNARSGTAVNLLFPLLRLSSSSRAACL